MSFINAIRVKIDNHTAGQLVAAPGDDKRIVVLGMAITLDGAGDVQLLSYEDEQTSTTLTGEIELAEGQPFILPATAYAWATCHKGQALHMTAGAAANGVLIYRIADL